MQNQISATSMAPYLKQFMLIQLLLIVILFLVQAFIVELPSAMGIISVMAAAAAPCQKFAADHQREMLKQERMRFANLGALLSTALSLGLSGIAVVLSGGLAAMGLADMPVWVIGLIAIVSLIVCWLVLYFSSGFMVRGALKRLKPKP